MTIFSILGSPQWMNMNYSTTINDTQDRLDRLYNAITPLLNNLKANPEKEYILWPNRVEKVEQFETLLYNIYKK